VLRDPRERARDPNVGRDPTFGNHWHTGMKIAIFLKFLYDYLRGRRDGNLTRCRGFCLNLRESLPVFTGWDFSVFIRPSAMSIWNWGPSYIYIIQLSDLALRLGPLYHHPGFLVQTEVFSNVAPTWPLQVGGVVSVQSYLNGFDCGAHYMVCCFFFHTALSLSGSYAIPRMWRCFRRRQCPTEGCDK